uniref:FKB95-like N-terminal Kelch domain-containing protein n=1 Tax=Brassica oleracea var. oleracea TaxID=109376 RepID=A0A0D3DGN0_BRAOL
MNSNDEHPQGNKNTNPPRPLNLQSHSFSSLPDEIAEKVLARISRCNYPIAVGSELYIIGGTYNAPSSAVRILDCRTHTWRDGPSMLLPRWCLTHANAFLLDEKIYVMGRWGSDESQHNWMEMLDIKTQKWRHLRIHGVDEFDSHWFVTNMFEEKMYAIAEKKSYAYDTLESRWEVVETHRNFRFINDWCVIEDVMYCFTTSGYCMWYDSKTRDWIDVKGSDMELLRMHRTCGLAWRPMLRILNLGGKLLVMWIPESKRNKREPEGRIWCAKIALEKRESEVWGKIEWANSVYDSYWFSSCVVSI